MSDVMYKEIDEVEEVIDNLKIPRIMRIEEKWDQKGSFKQYTEDQMLQSLGRNLVQFTAAIIAESYDDHEDMIENAKNQAADIINITAMILRKAGIA